MTRRSLLAGTAAPLLRASAPVKRPNAVYIITGGQRWGLLSLRGRLFLQTPDMDRTGREGVLFTGAFPAASLRSPGRASYLSGRYAHPRKVHLAAPRARGRPHGAAQADRVPGPSLAGAALRPAGGPAGEAQCHPRPGVRASPGGHEAAAGPVEEGNRLDAPWRLVPTPPVRNEKNR